MHGHMNVKCSNDMLENMENIQRSPNLEAKEDRENHNSP
jgi:hypothetical protein